MPQVEIVQASAGSGKTFTLSKRYLELVLAPGPIGDNSPVKSTLAITFTNNAAVEMKSRIIEYLKKIALDSFRDGTEKKAVLKGLSLKDDEARQAASAVMECIIRQYDLFSVRTIDSFINTLLTGSAFKLGVSAGFRIEDLFREYIEYSFDDMVDSAGKDKELYGVFKNFLEQYIYIEGKEGWIARKDILELLTSLFSIRNIYGGVFERSNITNARIIEKKALVIKKISELRKELPEKANKTFVKGLDKFLDNNEDIFDMADLSTYFTHPGIPVNKGAEVTAKAEKIWKDIKGSLKTLAEWEMYSRFNCYIDLYDRTERSLTGIAEKEDIIFLEELNRRAMALFGDDGLTVEEIYARLATRFMNYLLDEFQDTSVLQWSNIRMMVEEALSSGGGLFLVGDKKQAIYRFRGGDITLFGSIRKIYDSLGVEEKILDTNYRSAGEIVKFNNMVFDPANLKRFLAENPGTFRKGQDNILRTEDAEEIVSVYDKASQKAERENESGYVDLRVIETLDGQDAEDVIKEKLTGVVKELLTRMPPGDIAILTRSNDDSRLATGWLLDSCISVQSDKTLDIREHFLIKEITALFRFLESPIDNINFSAFILGDVFLRAAGRSKEEISSFIFSANRRKSPDGKKPLLYKEFRKAYPDIWDGYLNVFFKRAGIMPVYEFAVSILARFECMKNFPGEQAFTMKFLEFIKSSEDRYSGISGFLSFLDKAPLSELYVNVRASGSVRIMTIHQAKGLEFGAVILPFMSMNIKIGAGKTGPYGSAGVSRARPFVVKPGLDGIKLLYLNKDYAAYSTEVSYEYREEYKKAVLDELNIAYVALTRARNELYIFIEEKKGTRANQVLSLFPEKPYTGGQKKRSLEAEKKPEGDILKITSSKQSDWIELIKEEFVKDTVLSNRQHILRGNICHFILSRIGAGKKNIDKDISEAERSAKLKFPLSEEIGGCADTVRKVVNNKKLKDYFYPEKAEIYVEKDIVSNRGDMRRIDRLVVTEKEAVVIDYKNTRIKGDPLGYPQKAGTRSYRAPASPVTPGTGVSFYAGYIGQVKEYMEILKDIYPDKKIKGVLVYLEDNTVENV